MAKIDLTKYGITGTTEIVYNPSYEVLFEEETKAGLEGFLMNTRTTTILQHRKLGQLVKHLLRKNFPTRNFS